MNSPFIAVLGSLNVDTVLRVSAFPAPGETVLALQVKRNAGGKGANQAVAAVRAGARVQLLGAVGRDPNGDLLRQTLVREGVDSGSLQVLPQAPTGSAFITVDDAGENQIIVDSGANSLVEWTELSPARVYLAQLESPLKLVETFLSRRPEDAIGILNAAPFRPGSDHLFKVADYVIVNEIELAAYAQEKPTSNEEELVSSARRLLANDNQHMIVTLGSAGSLLVGHNINVRTTAKATAVVDTTGAGDCFCGFFAANMGKGRTVEECIAIAHWAAGHAVGRAGALASFPTADQVPAAHEQR